MVTRFAKSRASVDRPATLSHSNDNRRSFVADLPRRTLARALVCRWRVGRESRKLECHWELEEAIIQSDRKPVRAKLR